MSEQRSGESGGSGHGPATSKDPLMMTGVTVTSQQDTLGATDPRNLLQVPISARWELTLRQISTKGEEQMPLLLPKTKQARAKV